MARVDARIAILSALAGSAAYAWSRRSGASPRGCVALVTGASRGLGFLIARELLRQGACVAICARDEEELLAAAERLEREGSCNVLPFVCDVADRRRVEEMVHGVVRAFGRLDMLVNNAATIHVGPYDTMGVADLEDAMDGAFWGTVHTTLAVLPFMRGDGGGRIANITSIGGKVAVPHLLPYGCAKAAAVAFSEAMGAELAGSGISVTTVVPGLMRTGSPVNVSYRGRPEAEFQWFAAGDTLPFTSMDAQEAARRIVLAMRRREKEVTLGWQAKLLRMAHGLAPGAVLTALGLVNRLLPSSGQAPRRVVGKQMESSAPAYVRRTLERAAASTNQRAAAPEPAP